ncbi:NADP-dependent oxidoreductase [Actinoplanes sp. NPDC026619]|uniref:NADP-dependent oxidoreductase n=1 Tax=Actinoplanes sp. NPDC026619 TaxID=3155798 RepID=UPI0033E3B499
MRIHEYGDADVIRLDEVPLPAGGEVLIKVAATSFNPSDIGIRRGFLRVDLPYAFGIDLAGTVVATGDRVIGRVDTGGTAAEYVTAPAGTLVAAPTTVPLPDAAAIPIAGLTAWQAVFDHAQVEPGQRVLVNGAGGGVGGVGGFAVQLAKHAGAYVIATASPRSAETVRSLGADEVIDYTAAPLTVAEPVAVLLHLVPGPAPVAAVRPGGVIVSVTGPVEATGPADADLPVTTSHFVARNDTTQLAALVGLIDAGVVRLDIAARRPLAELASVHRDAEAGRLRGKTIIVP